MEHAEIARVVRKRLKQQGRAPYRAALDAGLPDNAIRYVLEGRAAKSDRLIEIARALGLEFYFGPPRLAEIARLLGLPADAGADGILDALRRRGGPRPAHGDRPGAALPREIAVAFDPPSGSALKTPEKRLEDAGGVDGAALKDEMIAAVRAEIGALRQEAREARADQAKTLRRELAAARAGLADAVAAAGRDSHDNHDNGASAASRPVAVHDLSVAAGGGGLDVDNAPARGRVWFQRSWLDGHGVDPTQCVVIGVRGDSMEPTLADGCSILVDRARVRRRAGRVYVIRTGDGLVAKRLGRDKTGGWVMISDNPAWPDAAFPEDARIIGEVRWTARKLDGA